MSSPRQMPVNVATAPMSVRPCDSFAISAPASKSSRWMRTDTLAPGHRREERDLARARDLGLGLDVIAVDRGADHVRVLERVGIFLAATRQPRDEIGDRAYRCRRID